MYNILENKQVMKQTKGKNYELWNPIGSEQEIKKIETDTEIIYKHTKFDIDLGDWVDDLKNKTPIKINDEEFIPVNGKIKIAKV